MTNKTVAAKKNLATSIISFALNALVTFISSPILLAGLGSFYFGIWKTLQKLFDIASVADGRSGQILKMIIARSETDNHKKNEAITTALLIWLIYLPFSLAILFGFYKLLPLFIQDNLDQNLNVQFLFFCLALNFILAPLISIPDAILIGSNLGYKSIWIQISGLILITILSVIAVDNGHGLKGIGLTTICISMLVSFLILQLVRKTFIWLKYVKPSKDSINTQLKKTLQMNGWLLIEKLILNSDLVIIAILLGPAAAGNFSFLTFTPQLILATLLIACSSLTPGIASTINSDPEKFRQLVSLVRNIIFSGAIFSTTMFIYSNELFVKLWAGETVLPGDWSNLILGVSLFFTAIIRLEAQLQDLNLEIKKRLIHGGIGVFISALSLSIYSASDAIRMDIIISLILLGKIYIAIHYIKITNSINLVNLNKLWLTSLGISFSALTYVILKLNEFSSELISLIGIVIASLIAAMQIDRSSVTKIRQVFMK